MAELKKYLNERGLREVWDIINGQNSLIVSKIKDIQKRTTVGLYADSTSGWAENESKISEAGALYIYTDAETFNGKVIAKVKIGDGTSSLADLSFIDAPYSAHIADRDIHFTAEERAQWNDEISAFVTAAQESANTAEEAANRAETAKTSAETSAAQASASAQQTTADKTATAGYAQTAKTNSDSTAADRQAVQTLAEQVTADKATVADHAAKVAEDRTAAETAAQTAQAVADSLPEDYVTAVGKIAENTAEINNTNTEVSELKEDLFHYVHKNDIDSVTADNAQFIIKTTSSQVCDNSKITRGCTMNIDGATIVNESRAVTDYIYCYGESVFSTTPGLTGAYCFYGKNKNFLGYKSYANVRLNLPIPISEYSEDIYYMRLSLLSVYDNLGVYFSETAPAYSEYYKNLSLSKEIKVPKENLDDLIKNMLSFYLNEPKRIISKLIKNGGTLKFIGDSITQGVGGTGFNADGEIICTIGSNTWKVNTNGYCFANLFKNYVMSKFANVNVINYGTRSFTSSNLMAQIKLGNIIDGTEDVIVCMIGTNDKWSGDLQTLKSNIQFLIDTCKTNGTDLILMSAPISTVALDTTNNGQLSGTPVAFHNEDVDHAYKEICESNNMPYISMYQLMLKEFEMLNIEDISTMFSDGLHPNDKGYYLIYKIIMREFGLAYQMPNSEWDDASPTT